jgi:WD repeat-containing protein 44
MSIHKVTQGNFCVRPQDELKNKAEGPSENARKKSTTTNEVVERLHRIQSENGERLKFGCIGSNSLGNDTRYRPESMQESSKERRKSAGNAEDIFKQMNVSVRMRTDSGKHLSDHEILEQVPVKNLDTGENFPLSVADEKTEQCINPLSLYIMQYLMRNRLEE